MWSEGVLDAEAVPSLAAPVNPVPAHIRYPTPTPLDNWLSPVCYTDPHSHRCMTAVSRATKHVKQIHALWKQPACFFFLSQLLGASRRVPPAVAVAEVIREKGPTRVQSGHTPYPVASNGPPSAPAP
ncbi:unnamed protein product [Pleuronectes platessa]|uniref:Uncharacterized protein n=1 Tax=Pleuronectes platessa TaxID=8262 RepID=A0A9N7UJ32_PLEPL|nr:unnamed protein product [Pleuronectes platessa]